MYDNEKIIGDAVRESKLSRKDLFLTTKLYRSCTSYQKAKDGIEQSLEQLQSDYIDLLLIHEPYDNSLEMYEALKEAYQKKKVRAIGISNFNIERYRNFICSCEIIPAINQVESHVYYSQLELKEFLENHGTKMQSWGSFTEGRKDIFADPLLREIGKKYGKTSAQVALRYLVQQGIAVIPKSVHRERMIQNFNIFNFTLQAEDMENLRSLDSGQSLFDWY